jgi:hypothetical protein
MWPVGSGQDKAGRAKGLCGGMVQARNWQQAKCAGFHALDLWWQGRNPPPDNGFTDVDADNDTSVTCLVQAASWGTGSVDKTKFSCQPGSAARELFSRHGRLHGLRLMMNNDVAAKIMARSPDNCGSKIPDRSPDFEWSCWYRRQANFCVKLVADPT